MLVLGASLPAWLAAVAPAEAHGARVSAETRALLRCRRTIEREALAHHSTATWRLTKCARAVSECTVGASSSCSTAPSACNGLPGELARLAEKFRNRVRVACDGVPLANLTGSLAFGDPLADCPLDSADAFAACIADALAASGRVVFSALEPDACRLLAATGLDRGLPAGLCTDADDTECPLPEPEPETPAGALFCGGADAVACPEGFRCDRTDALCSLPDAPGRCVPASACDAGGSPVCGCDGQTYASDCERVQAGVTKSRDGACDPAPECGIGRPDCPAGYYCELEPGTCGETLVPGVCRPARAEPCNLCAAWAAGPVCGCNMQTYATDCERRAAGTAKFFDGPCF
jgi:hypothetical protein